MRSARTGALYCQKERVDDELQVAVRDRLAEFPITFREISLAGGWRRRLVLIRRTNWIN